MAMPLTVCVDSTLTVVAIPVPTNVRALEDPADMEALARRMAVAVVFKLPAD
jgi:hypothetical protein